MSQASQEREFTLCYDQLSGGWFLKLVPPWLEDSALSSSSSLVSSSVDVSSAEGKKTELEGEAEDCQRRRHQDKISHPVVGA